MDKHRSINLKVKFILASLLLPIEGTDGKNLKATPAIIME